MNLIRKKEKFVTFDVEEKIETPKIEKNTYSLALLHFPTSIFSLFFCYQCVEQ